MEFRLKRYRKEFIHSYAFGVFPTIELLLQSPENAIGVVLHPKGLKNEGVSKIQNLCKDFGIENQVQEKTFLRLGTRGNDFAIGIFRKNETGLDPSKNHVVLVNPSSKGNIGTIMRTMLGFNFKDMAVIMPSVDVFHPEVVRASMGALFQLRLQQFTNFEQYIQTIPNNIYPLLTDGINDLRKVNFKPPFCLVFGNESTGLTEEYLEIGTSVSIPQDNSIDSLNLAVAVGVTLFQASMI